MIDTICLLIPKEKMIYLEGIASWELYSKTDEYAKYVRNPSKAEKETGNYFPRLTGYNRRFGKEANVRLEFSAPKLLYLNNLDELEDQDFPKIIEILQKRLATMGVIVEKSILENTPVSSVHYSKNIKLEDGYTASHIIGEINKIDLRKSFDFTKARFINNGQSFCADNRAVYAHTSSHELIIYDKIADLGKDKKRAIDKNQTLYQFNLFSALEKKEWLEVVRFEVRLNHKRKMDSVLENLGYKKNPVFKDVFNAEMSKKVVLDYWHKLVKDRNLGIFSISLSIKDMLQTLFLADKNLRPDKGLRLLCLFMLAKDEGGMRELRTIVSKRSKNATWYRMAKDTRLAGELITKNKVRDWVKQIDQALEDYKPYKVKNYENK